MDNGPWHRDGPETFRRPVRDGRGGSKLGAEERERLRELSDWAVDGTRPAVRLADFLPPALAGRTVVVGAQQGAAGDAAELRT